MSDQQATPTPTISVTKDGSIINNIKQRIEIFKDVYKETLSQSDAGKRSIENYEKVAAAGQKAIDAITNASINVSEQITGEAMVKQAESMLAHQAKYNNVLATRLAEALDEIKALKARVDQLEAQR